MLTMNTNNSYSNNLPHPNLTVQAPYMDLFLDDPTTNTLSNSPNADSILSALSRYLPSNGCDADTWTTDDYDVPVDLHSCDSFRMYEFKVRKCARARSHDWTECPFAHPGEKARRRDPRKHRYSGTPCPEYKKGTCRAGEGCEYAHGVFEVWLHPSRYRTQPCKDGTMCRRRVCFFAHTPDQIRVDCDSTSARSDSPPLSPSPLGMSELAHQMAKMRVNMGMSASVSPPGWGMPYGGSPRSPRNIPDNIRAGFFSLPSTPTKAVTRMGAWEESFEEEPVMERVESGRVLRAQMYAKLSRENSLCRADPNWITG